MNVITLNDRIHRRSGHVAVPYKNCMLVWSGYMERILDADEYIALNTYHPTDEIWVYNCLIETWSRILTKGDIPPRVSGSCAVLNGDDLYTFGGFHDEPNNGTTNLLYRLNLETMVWQLLSPRGEWPSPCDKLSGWAYKDKLYFFGGYGPVGRPRSEFQFVLEPISDTSSFSCGWNNQLAIYNITSNCWEWPQCRGEIPAPRAAHAAAISGNKVYIFGGRMKLIRNNELHCLNLDTMTWSGNLTNGAKSQCGVPEGRTWHSLTFISPDRAVLYGGVSQHNAILSDCWELHTRNVYWLKCNDCKALRWHQAVYFNETEELVIQGGLKHSLIGSVTWRDHADELLLLAFAPKSLFRLCMDQVCRSRDYLEPDFCILPVHLQRIIKQRICPMF